MAHDQQVGALDMKDIRIFVASSKELERVVKILEPLVANEKKGLADDLNQAVELLAKL